MNATESSHVSSSVSLEREKSVTNSQTNKVMGVGVAIGAFLATGGVVTVLAGVITGNPIAIVSGSVAVVMGVAMMAIFGYNFGGSGCRSHSAHIHHYNPTPCWRPTVVHHHHRSHHHNPWIHVMPSRHVTPSVHLIPDDRRCRRSIFEPDFRDRRYFSGGREVPGSRRGW